MTYTLLQQNNGDYAHLTFTGPFLGRQVTWNTHFYTLKACPYVSKGTSKGYIEISPVNDNEMKLVVALNIPEINHPAILKMMIMIRQYRNLTVGKHEYGK